MGRGRSRGREVVGAGERSGTGEGAGPDEIQRAILYYKHDVSSIVLLSVQCPSGLSYSTLILKSCCRDTLIKEYIIQTSQFKE